MLDRTSDYATRHNPDPEAKQTPDSNPVRSHLVWLRDIIGFPPIAQGEPVMQNLQANAVPVAMITPCEPNFQLGMTLFRAKPENEKYVNMVEKYGYIVSSPLAVAFIPDVPVSETVTNEYGESFLNKMTDVVSGGFSEINQIMGKKDIIESAKAIQGIGAAVKGAGHEYAGGAIEVAGRVGEKTAETMRGFANSISKGAGDLASKLLAGARIDFPFIWKNSTYSQTVSITVRLYNPVPGNDFMHDRYIVGPLVALLTLATPTSDHMNVYSWPFIHKIKCPGYFNIDPGTITSISITRGAENQISFGQRPSLVDVRLEFGSLHSVMLNSADNASADRPSIIQLRNTLLQKREVAPIYVKPQDKTDSSITIQSEIDKNLELIKASKNTANPTSVEGNIDLITKRVSTPDVIEYENLIKQSGFYPWV
jgi:hypothetical protein